jgi:DNA-binding NarL/FixJ family response regulator
MSKIRVLLADDHGILRSGLKMLIDKHGAYEVVAQASNTPEAVEKARATQPEVAIVDITMPGGGGVKAAEEIGAACPNTRVIALTMHEDPAYLKAMFQAGAKGFVVKRSADTRLLDAIQSVLNGEMYTDPAMGAVIIDRGVQAARAPEVAGMEQLSIREREVLALLARGHTNREAADHLGLSMRSVETYRARINEKLGFTNKADLVRYALERGVLTQGDGA